MLVGGVHRNEGPAMRNRIDVDHTHARAICRKVGERLQAYLGEEPELPASLTNQINRLREVERRSTERSEASHGDIHQAAEASTTQRDGVR